MFTNEVRHLFSASNCRIVVQVPKSSRTNPAMNDGQLTSSKGPSTNIVTFGENDNNLAAYLVIFGISASNSQQICQCGTHRLLLHVDEPPAALARVAVPRLLLLPLLLLLVPPLSALRLLSLLRAPLPKDLLVLGVNVLRRHLERNCVTCKSRWKMVSPYKAQLIGCE